MRMSHLFGRTLREAPADVELISHKLMLRAAMMRPLASGLISLLPMGWRVVAKVERIIREEMDAIGGQEMQMPVVHPADIWRASGRYDLVGEELVRFQDRAERDMVLAMTHEEVVTEIATQDVNSYRQLPMIVYHIQTKFRDEPRPRGGLIRVREFTMKDAYSLDLDSAGLDASYALHYGAYERIFKRMGLKFIVVGADTGMMGGSLSEEFMAFSPNGEDTILMCASCGYAANREVASFGRPAASDEHVLPAQDVATPNATTIAALAEFLGIPTSKTAKAVFYTSGSGRFVFVVIRGDLEVNETKLRRAVLEGELAPATVDQIRAIGAEPGYGSPIGVSNALIVIDESVRDTPNLVAGANREGFHTLNTNPGRDYHPDIVADIASAEAGFPCPHCSELMTADRAIEIGNIFKLGERFSETMGATYLDAAGESCNIVMGSYGIGPGRAAATIVEQRHDDKGIIWPLSVAPYHVHLLSLGAAEDTATNDAADRLYEELKGAGIEVLFDDRDERAGVKFNDADLIGIPLRVAVSARNLKNSQVELKERTATEATFAPYDDAVASILTALDAIAVREATEFGLA